MPLLNKAQALKVEKRKFQELEVPELGGSLRIASISAGCGLLMKELRESGEDQRAMSLAMIESCVVDEAGKPFFTSGEAAEFLNAISTETLKLIVTSVHALSGAAKVPNGVEVPAGNPSAGGLSASSPSA